MGVQTELLILFTVIIVGFLGLDLGYFNRKAHRISPRLALLQTLFWIGLSLGFSVLIFMFIGKIEGVEFLSAYVTEKMLSVDNLFVILLIFNFFKLDQKYYHEVLFWGIIGAIFFRAVFILAGVLIVSKFHFVLYIFGIILLITGVRLLFEKKREDSNFSNNPIYRFAKRYLPFTGAEHEGKFFIRENGKIMFTTLFMILLIVEGTDIIFAVDSIPAAFAISQNAFILFTSNIFAIMGLRSMFFLIEHVMNKFVHLQKGLSFILIFVGAKMLLDIFHIHITSVTSFAVIITILAMSLLLSVVFPAKPTDIKLS